jgi:hypothetical protein
MLVHLLVFTIKLLVNAPIWILLKTYWLFLVNNWNKELQ